MNSYNAFLTLCLIIVIGLIIQPHVAKLLDRIKKRKKSTFDF